jgi:hypothetical protein
MLGSTRDRAMPRRAGFEPFLRQPARFDILSRRVPPFEGADPTGDAIGEISMRLADLNGYVGDFRAGLELLKHADGHAAFARNWGPIACSDAAMALRGFRHTLRLIVEAMKQCRAPMAARNALRSVDQRFAQAFPLFRAGRNGGRGNGGGAGPHGPRRHHDMCDAAILANVTQDGRLVAHSSDGKAIRFELSEQGLWQLVSFRDEVFAAFEER